MTSLSDLTALLDVKFRNPAILETAFTHRSYLNEVKDVPESNERLEFLGDAVLGFIISANLYKARPKDTEGDLTNLRSYIVKTESLAKAASSLKLGEFLRLSRGEELSGGRQNTQLLANTFEALIGALYIDQGVEAAERLVNKFLLPNFEQELEIGPPKDNKSALQELVQTKTKTSPHYKILRTTGPDHAKQFVVGVFMNGKEVGQGSGASKQAAEEQAAERALFKITKTAI
jgi:ribonuclease III